MKLRIGGVPEHFNLPWHLMLESGELEKENIEATWQDFHGGTGSMIDALNTNEVDIAMLLTEGAVVGINRGGKYKIVSFYVSSPLTWGIHVSSKSELYSLADIQGKRYAISRFGSGSHLMSYLHADIQNWPLDTLEFVVVNNLDGARKALAQSEAEIFLWEKFTTKPYVDSGEFRLLGVCPTPYPCFTICVSNNALKNKSDAILRVINKVQVIAESLKNDPKTVDLISDRYRLNKDDVNEWIGLTTWAKDQSMDHDILHKVLKILKQLKLIKEETVIDDLVEPLST